jgi:hypothetical protein
MTRARRPERLSTAAARRVALAAQGLARGRPARPGPAALRRMFADIQLVQLDSVNVLVRSHELPLWARLGPHARTLLPAAVARGELFEYWGHEASLCPVALHPLLRWRMAAAADGQHVWGHVARMGRERRGFCDEVLAQIRARGPLGASEIEGGAPRGPEVPSEARARVAPGEIGAGVSPGNDRSMTEAATASRARTGWWEWSDGKRALEYLFWSGALTATRRPGGFERVYDLPERVLPPAVLAAPTPAIEDAQRALLARSARALGVATAADLADYFHMKMPVARPRIAELVEGGALVPVEVEGWRAPAFLDPAAAMPRAVDACALLSPFDSLVWHRERGERLFDFHYRIEIYTPAPKRRFGYYVLPFLQGDRLVARVDLKADRAAGVLRVRGAFAEAHAAPAAVAPALAAELRAMAGWLGLAGVVAAARGDLARPLRAALAAR